MSRWQSGVWLSALALTAAGCWLAGPQRVRVVLITLDTLRYDSFAGSEERPSAMPRLQEWARQAAIFERFYAATSSTQPSHASKFTGLHPWQHGVARNGQNLDPSRISVVETLRDAGFATAAVVASFPVSRAFGFDQGFETFHDEFVRGQLGAWADGEAEAKRHFYSLAETVTEEVITRIDGAVGDRQFFWFHYFDPHDPYGNTTDGVMRGPVAALERAGKGKDVTALVRKMRDLYDRDVEFLDRWLAELLARLESEEELYETHVVVVSDHGESFGEDGSMAHGTRLTQGQIHVPCLVRSPRVEPGRRSDIAGSVDIAATLLSLAGVEAVLPQARDLTARPERVPRAFGMRRVFGKGARFQRLDGKEYPVDEPRFYAVLEDGVIYRGNSAALDAPGAELAAQSESFRERLRRLFKTFEDSLQGTFVEEDLDQETLEILEALGYVP